MTTTNKKVSERDRRTGQYAYSTNLDRLCICGHPLAVHGEAGRTCLNEDVYCDPRATGEVCGCDRFSPKRSKR